MPQIYYAVRDGRVPGVYKDWATCRQPGVYTSLSAAQKQVNGYTGSAFKGFATLWEAKQAVSVYEKIDSAEVDVFTSLFDQFAGTSFLPDATAAFQDEFNRLASSQNWVPGSQHYAIERSKAIKQELECLYFPAKEPGRGRETEATDEDWSLRGYQALCREVRKEPQDTVRECQRLLKAAPYVNIINLLDTRRTGEKLRLFDDFDDFRSFTNLPGKRINLTEATKDELLASLLRDFTKGPTDQNPRYSPSTGAHAVPVKSHPRNDRKGARVQNGKILKHAKPTRRTPAKQQFFNSVVKTEIESS
ncbi:hypothetical protein BDV95DRAFT_602511 [Massariosphaeria phaeospora]|uniref:Ribonuclease H1 N-terminal domain-containing protein n=1 Tax=Massariosphaeria phaeospora TaxID=100035 RepID=A0A7C8IGD9_9PLEO|nr:hypothetical protein BDV95DRAFT_602511 [Massariosphaeria phaeospora]